MKKETIKLEPLKPRDPNYRVLASKKNAGGQMKDRKKAMKRGDMKHKDQSCLDEDLLYEKKPAGAPEWHDSDAPDANGKFKELGVNDLADWLIKTRGGDARRIYGSINQQIIFNRKKNPSYAKKMESVRNAVKRKLTPRNESMKLTFKQWLAESKPHTSTVMPHKYSVKLTYLGKDKHWPALKGEIYDKDVVIGRFSRAAVKNGYVPPIEYKFLSSQAKARFDDFADSLSIEETIEALLPKEALS